MSDLPNASSLIHRVAGRMRISAIARATYRAFLWLGGAYLVALLVSRFTGYIPATWFRWETLLAVPVLSLVVGMIFHRRPSILDSARSIDQHADAKDLFLTVSRLDSSAGGYQELVKRDAEKKSERIEPARVVPYQVGNRLGPVFMTTCVLALSLWLLPQLDPFGKVEAAEAKANASKVLEASKKATVARAEQLKKDKEDEGEASEAKKELKKLTDALKKMRPGKAKKAGQERVLVQRKQSTNKLFSKQNTKELREMLSKRISDAGLGSQSNEKMKKMLKELQAGKAGALLAELKDLKAQLKELSEIKDPVERQKKAREVKKKMQDLANFAKDKANSKKLAEALERAMQQMEAGQENQEMSKEAMKAAAESLELSEMEAQELAEAAKDLKQLEEALNAIQMARQLNKEGKLDASEMEGEGIESLEDYEELFQELMAEMEGERGDGDGGGGGEGQGEGGPPAEEDDSQKTGFQKEESKQQLQAGKNILSWKTKGMSEAGEYKKAVGSSLRAVKQGVSEAIRKEEVPPGYVDGIKKYFDNIEETMEARSGGAEASKPDAGGAAQPATGGGEKEK